jgi:galactokinase
LVASTPSLKSDGFGGSAIALVEATHADELCARLDQNFRQRYGSSPGLHVAQASAGVSESILG